MSRHVHLAIPDLLLPPDMAAEACAGLRLPALEQVLARGKSRPLPAASLEAWLCAAFGAEDVAPVTLRADGGQPGAAYWLRADPVHLMLRGSEVILRPIASMGAGEAEALCDSLNRHFAEDGLHFIAPPQTRHWYLRLEHVPRISTHSLARVAGKDMREYLPQGEEALHWHRLLNELQMLLYHHPVNQAREARGEWIINSLWLWGGGSAAQALKHPFAQMHTDSPLAAAFAQAAGIGLASLPDEAARWSAAEGGAALVWDGLRHAFQHGDLAEWRDSLRALERYCIAPMLTALRHGRIEWLTLDALQEHGSQRFALARGGAWQFWRLPRRLASYSPVAAEPA